VNRPGHGAAANPAPPQNQTDFVQQIRGPIGVSLVASATQALAAAVLVLGLMAELGAARTGVLLQAIALFTIVSTVARAGADVGVVRVVSRRCARHRPIVAGLVSAALVPVLIWSCLLALALALLAPSVGELLGATAAGPDVARALQVLAAGLPAAAGSAVLVAMAQACGATVRAASADKITRPLLQLLLCVAAAWAGATLQVVAILWVASIVVSSLPLVRWLLAQVRADRLCGDVDYTVDANISNERGFWRFSAARGVAATCQSVSSWLDTVLVGVFVGPAAAAVYVVAVRCLFPGLLAQYALVYAVQPSLSVMLASGRTAEAWRLCRVSAAWLVLLTWPVYVTLIGFADDLLRLLNPELVAGTWALRILTIGFLAVSASGPVDACALMAGRSGDSLLAWGSGLLVGVTLNFALLPTYGLIGAATAWSAGALVSRAVSLLLLRNELGAPIAGPQRRIAVALTIAVAVPVSILGMADLVRGMSAMPCIVVVMVGVGALAWRLRDSLSLPAARSRAAAADERKGFSGCVPA
jgi:O-antigen/teichoic acid export membrane protein